MCVPVIRAHSVILFFSEFCLVLQRRSVDAKMLDTQVCEIDMKEKLS